MLSRWTQLKTDGAVERAAFDLDRWGYRSLAPDEKDLSVWYRYGDDAIVFFNWNPEMVAGELMLHLCIRPGARSSAHVRSFMQTVYVLAQLHGAYRLRGEDLGSRRYLERLGWTEDERGWYRCLPGEENVDWSAMERATERYLRSA